MASILYCSEQADLIRWFESSPADLPTVELTSRRHNPPIKPSGTTRGDGEAKR
jgi:hypothetical protein